LWQNFATWWPKTNQLQTHTQVFCGKKVPKWLDFKGIFFSRIAIFRQFVPTSCQNRAGFLKKFLLSSIITQCSQTWLIPCVDDCQCGYVTKLKKKILT
jgi:hypothetical protein